MESITEAVLRFQESGEGYDKLVERISLIIYNFPERIHILSEEDKCDFYLSFHNRIDGLINNFTYQGFPFETLLNKTLKWHSRTYLSKINDEKKLMAAEVLEEEIKIKDLLQESPEDGREKNSPLILKNKTSKKRLLYLVLMDSPNLKDNEMLTFSRISGYDLDWLLELKDRLSRRLFERSRRLNELREKRNQLYMKLRFKEFRLAEEIEKEKCEILRSQIQRLKKRLDDTRYEISRVPVRPTHGEIAELLQIPKGTVDSGIHYLRKKCQEEKLLIGSGVIL